MEIKVLATVEKKGKKLLKNVKQALKELKLKEDIEYVTDIVEIANSGVIRAPGLIIDKKVVSSGDVSNVEEIKKIITRKAIEKKTK